MMYDPTFDDYYEPPDETGPFMLCPCEDCPEEEFYATTFREYQGAHPHGGVVTFIDDDSCPTCGTPGEEI